MSLRRQYVSCGTFSYAERKQDDAPRFNYDARDRFIYFQLCRLDHGIAYVRFFRSRTDDSDVPVPDGLHILDSKGEQCPALEQRLYVTWFESYNMWYKGEIIWTLREERQQTITLLCTVMT